MNHDWFYKVSKSESRLVLHTYIVNKKVNYVNFAYFWLNLFELLITYHKFYHTLALLLALCTCVS